MLSRVAAAAPGPGPPAVVLPGRAAIGAAARLRDGLRHPLLRDPAVHRDARRACSSPAASATSISTDVDPDHRPALDVDGPGRGSPLGGSFISTSVIVALAVVLVGRLRAALHPARAATSTRIGGNQQSALLMGLPVGADEDRRLHDQRLLLGARRDPAAQLLHAVRRTRCTRSGMELDAIAAVVIGGTLLTGGSGYVLGTVLGVLVLGLIQTLHHVRGHAQLLVDEDRHRCCCCSRSSCCSGSCSPGRASSCGAIA